jgi:hypothetical protein
MRYAKSMAKMSWEYIAGFFDGEGHVSLSRQQKNGENQFSRGNPRVTLVQAHERGRHLLEEISSFLRDESITSVIEIHHEGDERCSRAYRLRVTGFRGIVPFLNGVFPYLRIKKIEAQDMLRYDQIFPTLVGRGHSHRSNVLRAWETRRKRYGNNGYKNPLTPSRNGAQGCAVRWNHDGDKKTLDTISSKKNEKTRHPRQLR